MSFFKSKEEKEQERKNALKMKRINEILGNFLDRDVEIVKEYEKNGVKYQELNVTEEEKEFLNLFLNAIRDDKKEK